MPNEIHQLLAVDRRADRFVRLRSAIRPHAKRLFDFCAASILIIIVLPVACLIIIASLASAQVPFCSHYRIGRGGREFGCLKFRTMRRDADITVWRVLRRGPAAKPEWEGHRELSGDPRVTRLGRLLLDANLDELPQLLNVLVGHMSLVGPQPVTRAELSELYDATEAAAYCSVRPGLTGLWQMGAGNHYGLRNRAALDMLYVQRMSIRNDIGILWRTVNAVIRQEASRPRDIPANASGERHTS